MENIHSKYKGLKLIFLSCLWIGLFMRFNPAYSQVETKVEQPEQMEDSIVQYITPMEYAFMMHEATSWMVKASALLEIDKHYNFQYKISFEKRIAPSFISEEGSFDVGSIRTSIESRWYYRLNKRIKQNRVARSMSDNYLALGFDFFYYLNNTKNSIPFIDHFTLFAKWGFQRRFLRHGFADVGIKLGLSNAYNAGFSPSLIFNTYVNLGFAFTHDRYRLDQDKLCPVFRCYEGVNFIIKSNLNNAFGIYTGQRFRNFYLAPQIAFEYKIGNSAFSINAEINGLFSYYETNPNLDQTLIRTLMGKTGNGLSADYLGLGWENKRFLFTPYSSNTAQPQVFIITGWQRLFSKHLYYDIQIGLAHHFNENISSNEVDGRYKFAVGYRF